MFFAYLRGELGHRLRQFIVISLGLAVGIALAVTVTPASAGVKDRRARSCTRSTGSAPTSS
jgi:hypothetical protein